MVFLVFLEDIFILLKNEYRLGNATVIYLYSWEKDKLSNGSAIFFPYFENYSTRRSAAKFQLLMFV